MAAVGHGALFLADKSSWFIRNDSGNRVTYAPALVFGPVRYQPRMRYYPVDSAVTFYVRYDSSEFLPCRVRKSDNYFNFLIAQRIRATDYVMAFGFYRSYVRRETLRNGKVKETPIRNMDIRFLVPSRYVCKAYMWAFGVSTWVSEKFGRQVRWDYDGKPDPMEFYDEPEMTRTEVVSDKDFAEQPKKPQKWEKPKDPSLVFEFDPEADDEDWGIPK